MDKNRSLHSKATDFPLHLKALMNTYLRTNIVFIASLILVSPFALAGYEYRVPVTGLKSPLASCPLPWGGSLSSGQSITAYSSSTVPFGSNCSSVAETRSCANGDLSGSFSNQSCSVLSETDPYFSNVALAMHFDGSAIDLKGSTLSETAVSYDSATYKFGSSAYFNGTTSFISVASTAALTLGVGDFTVEFWYKSPGTYTGQGYNQTMGTLDSSGATAGRWRIGTVFAGTNNLFFTWTNGGYNDILTGINVNDNAWHHIALTRSGTAISIFVDGVKATASGSTSQSFAAATTYIMKSQQAVPVNYTAGNVDDVRITKGVARYTNTFTPPANPFPNN